MKNRTFEVNTPRSQAIVGRITDKELETDDMKVTVENPFANIVLTSLTDEPIHSSDRLLITAAGDQRNTDEVRARDGMSIIQGGQAPIIVEPIKGRLTLKTKDDVTVYRIGSTGERIGTARVEKDGNGYSVLCMRADDTCMNYEVVRTAEGAQRTANEHIVYEQLEVKPLFDDLAGYEWAQKAITRNVITGYMTGISESEFAPGADITRGDFIASVISACKITDKPDSNFADVTDSDKNKGSIGVAKKYGIANGDENGNFNPDSAVTLADAYTLLDRATTAGNTSKTAEDCFNKLFPNGFDGSEKLTRAQTASLIYTLLWE